MIRRDKTATTFVRTGERFRWTQPLGDLADEYTFGLLGVTAVASIWDARRLLLYRFDMQNLSVGDTEVTFTMPATETLKPSWIPKERAVMDILYSDQTPTGKILTSTIVIDILEGLTREAGAAGETKQFNRDEFNNDFDRK